jgi:ribosomal protein S18 acetylase RimI-like enzyme
MTQAAATSEAPELAVAVFPQFRNMGLGCALLKALDVAAARQYSAIQLNVRQENPAVRLYERLGFQTIGTMKNRAGGRSLVMIQWLAEENPHA